ncbi:MAG: hypothetical protein K0U66_00220 [Gammaproteobacteria bacterium]|nr:hypothetical protein [Gammaproteobacteria bacterium]
MPSPACRQCINTNVPDNACRQCINTNVPDNASRRSEAQSFDNLHSVPLFSVLTGPGKNTDMGRERRFFDILDPPRENQPPASKPTKQLAAAPQSHPQPQKRYSRAAKEQAQSLRTAIAAAYPDPEKQAAHIKKALDRLGLATLEEVSQQQAATWLAWLVNVTPQAQPPATRQQQPIYA